MIEQLLEHANKQVDDAEVYLESSTVLDVSFEAGNLSSVERKQVLAFGLRVIKDGRIGFASSTDPGRTDDLVAQAVASAAFGKQAAFSFPGAMPVPEVDTFDPAVESFAPETAVDEGRRAIELLKDTCPKGLTDVHISAHTSETRIINSAGLDVSYRSTGFSHGITSVVVEGDSILWIADGGEYGNMRLDTDRYVTKIATLAAQAERKAPTWSGTMPVVFTVDELPNLISAIEIGVNGKHLLKGDSPLIGREGERLLGTATIIDDPLRSFAPASCPFDDEGVPARTTVLFREGVFESFLFDLDTAAKTGHAPTGSASRGALSQPGIDTSNLVLEPGDSSLEDMIAGIDKGIIVHGVLGGGQSNLLAGDFALNVMLGFAIERGEIIGRLVDTMVSGNVYDAFGAIRAMSSEQKQAGALFAPDICFEALPVAGG